MTVAAVAETPIVAPVGIPEVIATPEAAAKPPAATTEEAAVADAVKKGAVEPVADNLEPPPERFAPKFAALAREEKRVRTWAEQRKAEHTQREAKIAQREAELEARAKQVEEYETAREQARRDPMGWMKAGNLTFDALVEAQLNGGKPTAEQERQLAAEHTEKEIRELKEAVAKQAAKEQADAEARTKAEQAQQEAAAQQADAKQMFAWKQEIAQILMQPDKYPILAALGEEEAVQDHVWSYLEAHFAQTNTALPFEEGVAHVEAIYRKRAERLANALPGRKPAAPAAPAAAVASAQANSYATARTLTNGAVTAPAATSEDGRPLPHDEAILAITQKYKSRTSKK